jgi:hypothetical protein
MFSLRVESDLNLLPKVHGFCWIDFELLFDHLILHLHQETRRNLSKVLHAGFVERGWFIGDSIQSEIQQGF